MFGMENNFSFIEKWLLHAEPQTGNSQVGKALLKKRVEVGKRALLSVRTELEAHKLVFTIAIFTNAKRTLKLRN